MRRITKMIKESLNTYSKREISTSTILFRIVSFQIWRLKISWYTRLHEGKDYDTKLI